MQLRSTNSPASSIINHFKASILNSLPHVHVVWDSQCTTNYPLDIPNFIRRNLSEKAMPAIIPGIPFTFSPTGTPSYVTVYWKPTISCILS